jgi:hypothetical protein
MPTHPLPAGRAPRGVLLALVLLTLAAAGLRLAYLSHGLPEQPEPDAIIVRQAQALERNPAARVSPLYPHMLARALVLLPGRFAPQAAQDAPLEEHLEAASRPFLITRGLIALLSILAIPGIYLLARCFLPAPWALLAAALVAFSLLHVAHARMARPHGALASFAVLALLGDVCIVRGGSVRAFAGAGLATALAVACLHSGMALLPPLAVAYVLHLCRTPRWRLGRMLIPPLLIGLSIVLFYPFLFDGPGFFAKRSIIEPAAFRGEGFARMARSLSGWEPVVTVLAGAGALFGLPALARGLRRWREEPTGGVLVVLAFALPYVAAIGMYRLSWTRFLMPLVPVLACLAAYGTLRLVGAASRALPTSAGRRALAAAAAGAVLALPVAASVAWVRLQSRADSVACVADWIRANATPRSRILVSCGIGLPLFAGEGMLRALPVPGEWERYQLALRGRHPGPRYAIRAVPPPLDGVAIVIREAWVRELLERTRVDLAVVMVPHPKRSLRDETLAAVRAHGGELVHRIAPYRSERLCGTEGGRDWLDYEPIRVAVTAERMGPVLEIYRFPQR